MSRRKEVQRALEAEMTRQGVPFTVAPSHKHPRLVFTIEGTECQYIFSSTTSCHRAGLNAVAGVRRMIRQAKSTASE